MGRIISPGSFLLRENMQLSELEILRCSFCGGRLAVDASGPLEQMETEVCHGVLGCECCAYPVVAGIPFLRAGNTARTVLNLLAEHNTDQALTLLLELDDFRAEQFRELKRSGIWNYREVLRILCRDSDAAFFLYRFSDPTFLVSERLLGALAQDDCTSGRMMDMCGGSGHLARVLSGFSPGAEVWLADIAFWKLWLAREFIVPNCHPICCDAAQPLPFARATFSLVLCSGALEYVWPRRLFAGEMLRLIGRSGVVALTHLHNSLCENPSPGMPLSPAGYSNLLEGVPNRLFKESAILDSLLDRRPLRLSENFTNAELQDEPALMALASGRENVFRDYNLPGHVPWPACPAINPLYEVESHAGGKRLRLRFPSEFYEAEFADCRRYLPDELNLNGALLEKLQAGKIDDEMQELADRRVILDLPPAYLA
jgi:uncharacterized protein YbaR (Trm112 family)